MKLIISIIGDADFKNVLTKLINGGFSVTYIASTGAFWKKGNNTLLIGVADDKVQQALDIIKESCTSPVQPSNHRATIFVLPIGFHINI